MNHRTLPLLLALLLLAALTGCAGSGSGTAGAGTTDMGDLQKAMLAADDTLPEMLSLTSEDEGAEKKFHYLSDFPYEKLDGFLLSYSADGQLADELAVLAVKDPADVNAAADSLRAHMDSRLKLYQTYGPRQAARVEAAQVFTRDRYAVLLICDGAQAVKDAFDAFLDGQSGEG